MNNLILSFPRRSEGTINITTKTRRERRKQVGIVPTLRRGNAVSDAPASPSPMSPSRLNLSIPRNLRHSNNANVQASSGLTTSSYNDFGYGLIERDAGASRTAFPRWSVGTINITTKSTKKKLSCIVPTLRRGNAVSDAPASPSPRVYIYQPRQSRVI